jgi:hypothetical protein
MIQINGVWAQTAAVSAVIQEGRISRCPEKIALSAS